MGVKILTNLAMNNAKLKFHLFDEPPLNPEIGDMCLIAGIINVYTLIEGQVSWLPLGLKRSFYKHVQETSSDRWEVTHNLGTYDCFVGVYDDTNKLIYCDFTFLSPDKIMIELNEYKTGRVIVFGDSNKLAGFNVPDALNQDTVSYGTTEPDASTDTTLYFQIEE
jgi:hypothetical protein